jgi:hypothetical protein
MSDDDLDRLRDAIQKIIFAAALLARGRWPNPDQLTAMIGKGLKEIRARAVRGAVDLPERDGDRWAMDLRREAARAYRLGTMLAHADRESLQPERDEIWELLPALQARQEELSAVRGFAGAPRAPAGRLSAGTALQRMLSENPELARIAHRRTIATGYLSL